MQNHSHNLSLFLEKDVFPTLWNRLDSAFPEFGFIKKGKYWMATVESITRGLPGSPRPDRVLVYQNTPFGVVIHGAEFITWIAYVSGTPSPRGKQFIEAVRKLAELAGVPFPESISKPKDRQQELFEAVFNFTQVELLGPRGERARLYLEKLRGLPMSILPGLEIGYISSLRELFRNLKRSGFRKDEIDKSGILSDSRWEERIVGPWRNTSGIIINFWSRDITGTADSAEKYIMLKGGNKSILYGLNSTKEKDLILVEGIFDAIALKTFGVDGAIAIGGVIPIKDQLESLNRFGCSSLTINLDFDGPKGAGHNGTQRAIQSLSMAPFPVFVVPPELMADPTAPSRKVDPDLFIRTQGLEAYRNLLDKRIHLYRYKARLLIEKHQTGPNMTDSRMNALIQEANAFGSQILSCPERKTDLVFFFWQEIVKSLGINFDKRLQYIEFQPPQSHQVISKPAH
jgi:putative DNA primase/helicase